MTRLGRVVIGGVAHHVTQRGKRRQLTFFRPEDYPTYLDLMAAGCVEHGLEVWAWCLMPNHVHLVVVPHAPEGLALGIGRAHWRFTRAINFRENWRGYLWQGRFSSCPMDGPHTLAAARYVERNPVRAGPVARAWEWSWSSAAALVLVLLVASASWGVINVRFTPKHLVDEADVIFAGPVEATTHPLEWKLLAATTVKGKPAAAHGLSLSGVSKDHVQDIQEALRKNGKDPAILFFRSTSEEKQAFLHLAGAWLALKAVGEGHWDVLGYSVPMSGVYTGGTDTLIRMSQYLAQDPDADVPVSAGVRWQGQAKVGRVAGEIARLTSVELGKDRKVHLFVASSSGDRLFRPKGEEAFEDVTAAAKLDSKSRAFTWVDLDGDGLSDLVTWDGATISVRVACEDGTFKRSADGFMFKPTSDCMDLAPCSVDGGAGVLVSTPGAPIWLVADAKTGWKKVDLPGGDQKGFGQVSPCVVADLDNDGYVDILQPGEAGGLLWRGNAGGFTPAVKVPAGTGKGIARIAMGDFNQDGALDIFLAGPEKNTLWQNDGKGDFKEVLRYGGSLSYKKLSQNRLFCR